MLIKIIFMGPMGSGKTTAIHTISDIKPLTTEAPNTDKTKVNKPTTTVAVEYGEVEIQSGAKLALYGMPGQKRFSFIWPIVASGALGGILLLDCSQSNWLEDYHFYIKQFSRLSDAGSLIVGLNRSKTPDADAEKINQASVESGVVVPFFFCDPRKAKDVYEMLDTLVMYAQLDQKLYGESE